MIQCKRCKKQYIGYSISFPTRDPARGTSQLYLRFAWTSAFKQFFIIFKLPLSFFIFFPPLHNLLFSLLNFLFPPSQFYYFPFSFLNSLLLHNFKLFPPPLLLEFLPQQFLLFSLLNLPPPPPPPHLF